MKKNCLISLSLILLTASLMMLACAKSDSDVSPGNTYQVTYTMISDNHDMTTSVKYRDASGNLVEGRVQGQQGDWVRTINVSQKPFSATMSANVANTGNDPVNFTLTISVNGELKRVQTSSAAASGTAFEQMEYIVE